MESESGILHQPEVEELLRQFELFEIFTDDPRELPYAAVQKAVTGYNANPTYIVLDSENHLEVARISFTNSKQEFIDFLKKGLTDRPAFISQVRFTGVELEERGEAVTVLTERGVMESTEGTLESYDGEEVYAYRGSFSGRQTFRVARDLDGKYPITVHLVTGLYSGDERQETVSISRKLYLEVID